MQERDLTCGMSGFVLWCVPACALFAGMFWTTWRPWLWIPALLVMGGACLVNAARCGRIHCYLTGPIFLLAAAYVVAAQLHAFPMQPGNFLGALFVLIVLGYLAEMVLGKYRRRA